VTWWHTVTGARTVDLGTAKVLLGYVGEGFEQHLVGGVDFSGTVNGKFAGYAKAPLPVLVLRAH